jgi:Putative DNA-binding domain
MSGRGKELFDRLQDAESIKALIGESEDVHFDCKEWPANDGDAQRVFAKAACGLTNAEGGVVLVGMKARAISKDEPDLVDSVAPAANTSAVKSRILDLVGQLVEPGIEGIQAAEVNEPAGSKSGFVVVYVPASEGSPRRSRKDSKFYVRIGSGTFPMEYFQIEERFGKRPPPKLGLYLEIEGIGVSIFGPVPERKFVLGLENLGSGIAKFPSIRYRRSSGLGVSTFGLDGTGGFGLPQRPSDNEWASFLGGVDDVIYPGEIRKITKLVQLGYKNDRDIWVLKASKFQCEVSCEGTQTTTVERLITEELKVWS